LIGNVSIDSALCGLGSGVGLMPYLIFKKLDLGELRPTNISLQLADRFIKHPLRILEDVSIKVGDFYVPIGFMILYMAEDAHIQIILGRRFLTTVGCKIDVKEGRLTFDVGQKYAEFSLFKGFECAPFTYSYYGCDAIDLVKLEHLTEMTKYDTSNLNCALFEGQRLDYVKVESMPPSIVKGKPYAVDEGYLSDLCKFVSLMTSMPPMSEVERDMDVDIEIAFEGGPSDGAHHRITLFMDLVLWKYFLLNKNLNPEFLR